MRNSTALLSKSVLMVCLVYFLSAGATPMKIGFNAGLAVPEGNYNVTIGGGGLLDFCFDLRTAGSIHIQPTVELWYASTGRYHPRFYQNYFFQESTFELSINPLGRYYFPVPSNLPVQPFIGMGFAISLDFSSVEQDYPGLSPSYHDNNSDLGFCLGGGIDFFIGRNRAFVEVREKMGDFDVFKLLFGMMFPFGSSR